MADEIDTDAFREKLLARARELEELSRISAEARGAVELDQASVGRVSRIDAIQQQAMALANERSRASELGRIKAALQRIEDGEYGYCIKCGDRIAEKRLAFDPSLATCVDCAA